jgi:hypothetical protein
MSESLVFFWYFTMLVTVAGGLYTFFGKKERTKMIFQKAIYALICGILLIGCIKIYGVFF